MTPKTPRPFQNPMEVLRIHTDIEGTFIESPNRFLAIVEIEENGTKKQEKVHVHDPGRLEDVLYPGNRLLLRKAGNPNRKTGWDLIAGRIGEDWVLTNSAIHRQISEWVLEKGIIEEFRNVDRIIPEQKFGDSRLDFLLEESGGHDEYEGDVKQTWIEVKGCTLAESGQALFPDAPTTRGRRHLDELIRAVDEGHGAALIVIVLRSEARCFGPNAKIDPDFAETFHRAVQKSVMVFPLRFSFKDNVLYYNSRIPLCEQELTSK